MEILKHFSRLALAVSATTILYIIWRRKYQKQIKNTNKPKSTQNTSVKNVVSNVPKLENIESVNATKEQLSSLIYLLNNNNQLVESDQAKILSTLTNAAAFATNMDTLRLCLDTVMKMAHNLSQFEKDDTKAIVLRLVNNLSMNIQNQKKLQILIQPLIDMFLKSKTTKVVQLATLQCLTNLSTLNEYHFHFVQETPTLLDRFGIEKDLNLKKSLLSILVNLSSNNTFCINFINLQLPECHNIIMGEDYADKIIQKKYISFINNILRNVKLHSMEFCEEGTIGYCLYNN